MQIMFIFSSPNFLQLMSLEELLNSSGDHLCKADHSIPHLPMTLELQPCQKRDHYRMVLDGDVNIDPGQFLHLVELLKTQVEKQHSNLIQEG